MGTNKKAFLMGLAVGLALTLVSLEIWGALLQQRIADAAQPVLLRPLVGKSGMELPLSSAKLPAPWLPEVTGTLHDGWTIRALDGPPLTLASLKGKAVFLNFWSTTCVPCIEEMPGIERLSESLRDSQVAFLAVTQEDEELVRGFLRNHVLNVPVFLAGKELPEDLKAVGVPITFILNGKGAAVFKQIGPVKWDAEDVRSYLIGLAGNASAE